MIFDLSRMIPAKLLNSRGKLHMKENKQKVEEKDQGKEPKNQDGQNRQNRQEREKESHKHRNIFKSEKSPSPKGNNNFYWIYGIMAVMLIAMSLPGMFGGNSTEIGWKQFSEIYKSGDIEKIVVVNNDVAEIYLAPEVVAAGKYDGQSRAMPKASQQGPHFKYVIGDYKVFREGLEKLKNETGIEVDIRNERRQSWSFVMEWILPFLLIIGLWIFFMRMMSRGGGPAGGIFSVGKSKARLYDKDTKVKVSFKDVAGLREAKMEIMEIVDFLKNPKKYTKLGGKIPKGALLVGPPGTGKTLLAKAVAGEAQVPFFSMAGSDFVEMFVGVGASRVRDLFKQAKEKAPCIIFIDEIDAIGRTRGKHLISGGNDEKENTLNQLLTEMDGFTENTGVIILGATNRAEILDKALLRAGRFDRQIYVDLPDMKEREEIFQVHVRNLVLGEDVDIPALAKQTPGFSGADIANVCNEAALTAARKNKDKISMQDFMDAIDRIVGGLEKKNKIISPGEKKVIAYHEAGHAAVSWMTKYAHPLIKVTIVPRGQSLGAAWYLPQERQITTYDQMFDELTATLGGRAAEQIVFGKISTGALNDLEKVTKQAYNMVVYFGLNDKLGNVSYYDSTGQQDFRFTKPYSEKTAELIDKEIKALIDKAYIRALTIVKENIDKIKELAELLIKEEVVTGDDVKRIFGERPFADELKKEEEEVEKEIKDLQNKNKKKKDGGEQVEGNSTVNSDTEKNNMKDTGENVEAGK